MIHERCFSVVNVGNNGHIAYVFLGKHRKFRLPRNEVWYNASMKSEIIARLIAEKNKIFLVVLCIMLVAGALLWSQIGAPQWSAIPERIVVVQGESEATIISQLKKSGFIRSERGFNFVLSFRGWHGKIKPGGYKISKSMNAYVIASIMAGEPYMRWVTIQEGLRKEEIADIYTELLGWDETDRKNFLAARMAQMPLDDGYYFPDTYLVSIDETGEKVAQRMYATFNEKFQPFASEALKQNVKHTTVVKLASIVEREAAGKRDMSIIAGVLWNRLEEKMPLGVDATIQYARGDAGKGWWAGICSADKKLESPFNTYKNVGLPPSAISNPGTAAINAVLHPAKTTALYYLHDSSKQIHVAMTYDQHLANIEKYLR